MKKLTPIAKLLCLSALLSPLSLSAASIFTPDADLDISLTSDTTYNYDYINIATGININYLTPENTRIDFISDGDIIINGSLTALNSTLSLTSTNGSIYLSGDLSAYNLELTSGYIDITSGTGSSGSGANGITLTGGSTILINSTGTLDPVISTPIIIGTVILNPITPPIIDGGTITLTPVPVPPSVLLFFSGLLTLSLMRRKKQLAV